MLVFAMIIAAFWIATGALSYAITLAYFQRRWPDLSQRDARRDVRFAIQVSIAGPVSLIVALAHSGLKYGLMWRPEGQRP